MKTFDINSLDKLQKVCIYLKEMFLEKKIVLFEGDMGMGKTTFIKTFCEVLKVEDEVSSPTFGLVNEYIYDSQKIVYHFDLYRVEEEEELFDIGFEEYLESGNLCFIEWPKIAENFIPIDHILVHLLFNEKGERVLQLK